MITCLLLAGVACLLLLGLLRSDPCCMPAAACPGRLAQPGPFEHDAKAHTQWMTHYRLDKGHTAPNCVEVSRPSWLAEATLAPSILAAVAAAVRACVRAKLHSCIHVGGGQGCVQVMLIQRCLTKHE